MTTVSCPGKVLLAGGYVVTDADGLGIVVPTSCRITSTVKWNKQPGRSHIMVYSAQEQVEIDVEAKTPTNFMSSAVLAVLSYLSPLNIAEIRKTGLTIEVEADRDFYTESGKTGLGSSSALVASLVSALLIHFGHDDIDLAFRIARKAHFDLNSSGSGFDIAAACYGPLIYTLSSFVPFNFPYKLALVDYGLSGSNTHSLLSKVRRGPAWDQLKTEVYNLTKNFTKANLHSVRRHVRALGTASGVCLEPQEYTCLMDQLEALPNVVGVGCPGAAGRDAFFVIYTDTNATIKTLVEQHGARVLPTTHDGRGRCVGFAARVGNAQFV